MITEEMLRAAAARSSEIYVNDLENGYDPNVQHEFSPAFEKKIRKLKRKADHPMLYRTMQRVASFALVLLISGSVVITVNAEARAAFVGWVKEVYETYFVFHHDGITDTNAETVDYMPTWIPDGYREFRVNASERRTVVIYDNEAGEIIRFSFIQDSDETDWFIDISHAGIKSATVNGNKANLLITHNSEDANAITWISDDTAFYVTGFVDENDLIRIAESVKIFK